MLIVSTQGLLNNSLNLNNLVSQANEKKNSYIAIATTQKIVSCHFNFSTFSTATFEPQLEGAVYMIHFNEEEEEAYSRCQQ